MRLGPAARSASRPRVSPRASSAAASQRRDRGGCRCGGRSTPPRRARRRHGLDSWRSRCRSPPLRSPAQPPQVEVQAPHEGQLDREDRRLHRVDAQGKAGRRICEDVRNLFSAGIPGNQPRHRAQPTRWQDVASDPEPVRRRLEGECVDLHLELTHWQAAACLSESISRRLGVQDAGVPRPPLHDEGGPICRPRCRGATQEHAASGGAQGVTKHRFSPSPEVPRSLRRHGSAHPLPASSRSAERGPTNHIRGSGLKGSSEWEQSARAENTRYEKVDVARVFPFRLCFPGICFARVRTQTCSTTASRPRASRRASNAAASRRRGRGGCRCGGRPTPPRRAPCDRRRARGAAGRAGARRPHR